MKLTDLALMYERAKSRRYNRISAQVQNEKSIFYTKKDEDIFLHDIDILQRAELRLKQAIIKRLWN